MKISSTMFVAVAGVLLLAACSSATSEPTPAPATSDGASTRAPGGAVTVLTYDSFALPDQVIADFERRNFGGTVRSSDGRTTLGTLLWVFLTQS